MNLSSRMRSSPKDAAASLLADDRASCMAALHALHPYLAYRDLGQPIMPKAKACFTAADAAVGDILLASLSKHGGHSCSYFSF